MGPTWIQKSVPLLGLILFNKLLLDNIGLK